MGISRDEFFALEREVTTELVTLPGGQQVHIRVLSGRARDQLDLAIIQSGTGLIPDFRAVFTIAVACDAEGQPLFSEADRDRLASMDHRFLDPIVEAGKRLNGMMGDSVDIAEKNSVPVLSDDSGSNSPDYSAAA